VTDHRPPRVEHIMGTAVLFDVRDAEPTEPLVDEAVAHLRWVEGVFSTFLPASEISRIRTGRLSIEEANPTVAEVLAACDRLRRGTDGAFDHRSGAELDPAGYVKGWAIEGAARVLTDGGAEAFLVSAGGDIVARGEPEGRDAWRVGLRDPLDGAAVIGTVDLVNAAVATSGRYERGDHIWGSHEQTKQLTGVSVVGPNLGIADALATAILAAGPKDLAWLRRFPDYGFVAVTSDRRILRTPGVPFASPPREEGSGESVGRL
jgi:thiamine biosynthesis lipoprotein